ncbi:CYP4V2 [Cordylochernes scorpioides]|uniref:CYP4V2 n=1 Tax=Cordylochernes scorpioides TaxID=51811 RepID=A0ABY6LAA0_9ARAC|nr:CYP4V2 [Cordylochernes scorpioides]
MTIEDVKEEVEAFMFTEFSGICWDLTCAMDVQGHDSASLSASWVLYLLGLHPEIQKRVHSEMDDVFGEDFERLVETEDAKKLKYLECVMKESQRLYPVVPYIGRCLSEDLAIDKYIIPAGSTVAVFLYMIHHSPDVYPNPETFDPDRFLPENVNKRHPFAYLPFSAGPRNCVGQKFAQIEQKVILSNILRRFRVTSLIQRDKLDLVPELVLTPKPGLLVRFDRREVNNNLMG